MKITPFKLKLKKVSARKLKLLEAVYEYLPATGVREEFGRGIKAAISRHLGEDFSLRLEAVQQEDYASFLSKLPKSAILAIVGLTPIPHKAIIEIDNALAMVAVERLLGGQVDVLPEPRGLSDMEQGVLQYLILQMIASAHRQSGKDSRVHFRFDRFAFSAHDIRSMSGQDDGVAVLVFRATLGRHSGFVRLILPDPFVEQGLLNVEAPEEIRPAERAWRMRQLERFGYVKVPMWAEVGRTAVAASDMGDLEEGDVMLFDHSDISMSGGVPRGKVVLKVGDGLNGGIDAHLSLDEKQVHCRIFGFHEGD